MRGPLRLLLVALVLGLALAPGASAARTGPVEFATAINDGAFSWGEPHPYRSTFLANHQALTHEHSMKMIAVQPQRGVWDWRLADQITDWGLRNGKKVHGHTLIWCSDQWTPSWVVNGTWTRAQLLAVMQEHIRTVVTRYKGRIGTWDVVNEAIAREGTRNQCVWERVIGSDWVEQAFRAAAAADPNAKLFYNEYDADTPNRKFVGMETLLKDLLARGVPLHGVGLQNHIYGYQPVQDRIEEAMGRVAALGLAVHVSELDVPTKLITTEDKLTQQAQAYQTIAAACQAQPACFRVTTWGHVDGIGWRPVEELSAPFDANYQKKPAWNAMQRELRPPAEPAGNRRPSPPGKPALSTPFAAKDLTLSWAAATDPDKNAAVSYTLQHKDADDAAWTTVATGIRTTSFAFNGGRLEREGTVTYRVLADDGFGPGGWSLVSDAAKVDRTKPLAPTPTAARTAEWTDAAAMPWFRDSVTVAFATHGDQVLPDGSPGAGVDPASVPASLTFSANGAHTATGTVRDRAGNESVARTRQFSIDAELPAVSASAAIAGVAYDGAWTRSDVGVSFACTDGVTGVASVSASQTVGTEGGGQRRVGECRDRVGHVVTATTGPINIDRTPPSAPRLGADRAPEDATGGFFRDRVTVAFAAAGDVFADGSAGSGVDPASLPAAQTFSSSGEHAASGVVRDRAGNESVPGTLAVRVDAAAPSASATAATADRAAYAAGAWTRQDVTVSFSCADDQSGVGTTPAPAVLAREGAALSAGGTCTDRVGHTAGASFGPVRIDRTPPRAPVITLDRAPEDPTGGWFADRVTARFAADGDPALPTGEAGSGVETASIPASRTLAAGGTFAGRVRDVAGNLSAEASRAVRVDADLPVVALTCPAVVEQGTSARGTFTASDASAGLATSAGGFVDLATSTVGVHTASVEARDRVGHSRAATCDYTVTERPAEPAPPAQEPTTTTTSPAPADSTEASPPASDVPSAPAAEPSGSTGTAPPASGDPAPPAPTSGSGDASTRESVDPSPSGSDGASDGASGAEAGSSGSAAAGSGSSSGSGSSAAPGSTRPATAPSSSPSAAPAPLPPTASRPWRVRTLSVRATLDGRVRLDLECRAGEAPGRCRPTLLLRHGTRRVAPSARATLAAAGRLRVTLRLTAAARATLRRRGTLTITALLAGDRPQRVATVRVRAPR